MAHNTMGIDPCDTQQAAIFNSMTEKRNNVQLRTGLFEACVPLPTIIGNVGFGPEVDMSLFYTPVVNNHAALGDGWSFAFTTYNASTQQLTLHTGEVLSVGIGEDSKTPEVYAYWRGGGTLEVARKDGRVETLLRQGDSAIWMPICLTTDGRRYVTLTWSAVAQVIGGVTHYQMRLVDICNFTSKEIGDPAFRAEAGRQLVTVVYEPPQAPSRVVITFWPGTDETRQYVLSIDDVALRSVTPPEGAGWESRFDYKDDVDCGWLLTSIVTFDGLTETVEYVPETRTFSDEPKLQKLPCVCRHTVKPRGGGPDVVTEYAYSHDKNSAKAAYVTTVTEKASSGGRTTTYSYDCDHSMINEMTVRGDCSIERTFSSEDESSYSTLSQLRKTTRSIYRRGTANWTESTESVFTAGALTSVTSKGVETTFVFDDDVLFPGAYLRREESGGAIKVFAYTDIDGLNRKRVGSIRTFLTAGGAAIVQDIDYEQGGFRAGLKRCVQTGLEDRVEASRTTDSVSTTYDYRLAGTKVTVTTTESRGSQQKTSAKTVSILSGRLHSEVDLAGNRTEYGYDGRTGRLASRTQCVGSAGYEAITRYAYPSVGRMEITEPDGRRRAIESDGRDNVIMESVAQSDTWTTVLSVTYDDLGRKSVVTRHDWTDGVPIAETCTSAYDNWGKECRQTYGDGRSVFQRFDPVTGSSEEWEGDEDDQHRKRTRHARDDSVRSVEWLDERGECYLEKTLLCNDAGKPVVASMRDNAGGERVQCEYDPFGRLKSQRHVISTDDVTTQDFMIGHSYRTDDVLSQDAVETVLYDVGAHQSSSSDEMFGPQVPPVSDTEARKFVKTLGKREFDAWGRVTSITRAGITETMAYTGTAPVPSSVTKAGGATLNYEYIPQLAYRPAKVSGSGGDTKVFTYMHGATRQSMASQDSAELTFDHDLNERVTRAKAIVSKGVTRSIERRWSEGGRLLSETDAAGGTTRYTYNQKGQRTRTLRGTDVQTDHAYDASGRLASEDIAHGNDKARVDYVYDAMRRECARVYTLPDKSVLTLSRECFANGRVKSEALTSGDAVLGSKAYTYDASGRLASCTTAGAWRPRNPKGKPIDSQTFTYDVLGNLTACVSRFGTEVCNSAYAYDASGCRLSRLEHDHADYRTSATLEYDKDGRLTRDALGKTYAYDWLGRLSRAGSRHYTYDGMDRLMTCGTATETRQLVYDGMELRGEHGTDDTGRYFYPGSAACSIQRVKLGGVDRTLFELSDASGTVIVSYDVTARTMKHHAFSAYGERSSEGMDSLLGFHGGYRDMEVASQDTPAFDRYPSGQGYRWYLPGQMQFHGPDSESPFGVGGWHAYGYCDGDPVNRSDASGHSWFTDALSWVASSYRIFLAATPAGMLTAHIEKVAPDWMKKATKIGEAVAWGVAGIVGAVFTGGASLVLLGIATTLATVSAVTSVVATVLEDSDPETAAVLNWISFGTGLGAGVSGSAALAKVGGLGRQGAKWMQQVARSGTRGASRAAVRHTVKTAGASIGRVADDALGAIVKGRPSMQAQLYERAIRSLKPFAAETSLLAAEGVTGALGNAGVFESESADEAANESAETIAEGVGLATGEYNLTGSVGGRMRNPGRRGGARLRFR